MSLKTVFKKKEWNARLMIERSKAIKAPKIEYQLAGFKKFQQVLSKPGVIEKFIEDKNIVDMIRATFVDQFAFSLVGSCFPLA
jgi:glutathione synthase